MYVVQLDPLVKNVELVCCQHLTFPMRITCSRRERKAVIVLVKSNVICWETLAPGLRVDTILMSYYPPKILKDKANLSRPQPSSVGAVAFQRDLLAYPTSDDNVPFTYSACRIIIRQGTDSFPSMCSSLVSCFG